MTEKYKPENNNFDDPEEVRGIKPSIPTPDFLNVSDKVKREVDADVFSAMSDLDLDGFDEKGMHQI